MNLNIQKAQEIFERATSGLTSKEKSNELLRQYLSLIRKAAYSGNSEAQFLLGTLYQDEQFMSQIGKRSSEIVHQKKSFKWFEKACAQNHPYACHNLGGFYGDGKIVRKNIKKEMDLYLKSFKLGLSEAGYAIAISYKEQLNYEEAISWLKRVLEKEPNDGEAMFQLGKFYYEGLGVKKSFKKAYNLFYNAIASDYITQYTKEEILFLIGKMYFYGEFLEHSPAKAKYLFMKANTDNDHEDITLFCSEHTEVLTNVRSKKVLI